jgi:hypothetical protein
VDALIGHTVFSLGFAVWFAFAVLAYTLPGVLVHLALAALLCGALARDPPPQALRVLRLWPAAAGALGAGVPDCVPAFREGLALGVPLKRAVGEGVALSAPVMLPLGVPVAEGVGEMEGVAVGEAPWEEVGAPGPRGRRLGREEGRCARPRRRRCARSRCWSRSCPCRTRDRSPSTLAQRTSSPRPRIHRFQR